MKEIDENAPIIPYEGLGGIKLYSTKEELKDILSLPNVTSRIYFNKTIRYEIPDTALLFFDISKSKLFKITATGKYSGKVFEKIGIGMTEEELVTAEPSFVYDDFEEVWISDKGILVETDPETDKVMWISVYIPELDTKDFEEGNW